MSVPVDTLPCELHLAYVAVDPVHHCPHVTVVSVESSGDIYMYDNVTPGYRMRVNSIIDLIPYVFEYYRVHVFKIDLPDGKEDCTGSGEKSG